MPYQPDTALTDFIQALPKTETHLHIEGALAWDRLHELDPEMFADPPRAWADGFKYRSFAEFEKEILEMAFAWYKSPERYHETAKLAFAKQVEQNVRYSEVSFASAMIEFGGLPGEEIIAAIHDAVPAGLEVRVFMGIHHNTGERMMPILERATKWEGLAGLDIHGVEWLPLEDWTPPLYAQAEANGKFNKAHAGEFCGAPFVAEVLDRLKVKRIEHGVRAIEDPAVVKRLADEGVGLDVCPISNIKLDVFPTMKDHSLRKLIAAGVRCSVSTDDPVVFGNTLNEEYAALAIDLDFSRDELVAVARSGFKMALVDEDTRRRWIAELDAAAGSAR